MAAADLSSCALEQTSLKSASIRSTCMRTEYSPVQSACVPLEIEDFFTVFRKKFLQRFLENQRYTTLERRPLLLKNGIFKEEREWCDKVFFFFSDQ